MDFRAIMQRQRLEERIAVILAGRQFSNETGQTVVEIYTDPQDAKASDPDFWVYMRTNLSGNLADFTVRIVDKAMDVNFHRSGTLHSIKVAHSLDDFPGFATVAGAPRDNVQSKFVRRRRPIILATPDTPRIVTVTVDQILRRTMHDTVSADGSSI